MHNLPQVSVIPTQRCIHFRCKWISNPSLWKIVNGKEVPERVIAEIIDIKLINIYSKGDTEVLIIDLHLDALYIDKFIR